MHYLVVIIDVCWIAFWTFWIISAFSSKKGTTSNIKQFVGIRVVILVLVALMVTLDHNLPQSFKHHFMKPDSGLLIFGFIVFLLGMMLAVWARIYLGRNWGLPMTQKQNPELVTAGPYRYIRHPIYSGILLMALGSAIDVNIYWLLVLIVAAVYFIYSAIAEEQLMIKQFPKTYPAYKNRTKMLIPFVL